MKNYELIQQLLERPAGAEIYFGHTVTQEDMAGHDVEYVERKVAEVDSNDTSITLMG
ncbi:MAG: hypothetical protein K2N01_13270 [Lachnospiraceae bacterium]|nr:hypothetical protein [Lachnospiraceae bacterium]